MDITAVLKETLATIAPVLASALLPGSGGLAASLLAKALGTSTDPQQLLSAVQTITPEQFVEVKRIESDNELELARIGADLDKADLADRQSARERDVALQVAGSKNPRANWMVAGDVVGLCSCLVALVMLPPETNEAIRVMLASIASVFGLCLRDAHTFEFGTSRSSARKTELLAAAPAIGGDR